MDFQRSHLRVDDVLEIGEPGSICKEFNPLPTPYAGSGKTATRLIAAGASNDRSLVALMENGGDITIWRTGDGKLVRRFASGHHFQPESGEGLLLFNPQNTLLAEGGVDGFVRVWSVPKGKLRFTLSHSATRDSLRDSTGRNVLNFSAAHVYQMAFTHDGKLLGTTGGWRAYTWSMKTGKVVATLSGTGKDGLRRPTHIVTALHPTRFITSDESGALNVYLPTDGRPLLSASAKASPFGKLAASPDGRWIVYRIGYDSLAVWSVREGRTTMRFSPPPFMGTAVFSPDSKRFAIAGFSDALFIWEVESGRPAASVHGLARGATDFWFSASGDSIVYQSQFAKELYVVPTLSSQLARFKSGLRR
ncbi:MAG TPA: hypothetical protein VM053_00250 [Gemmatimonadaceae bacterium]|nr:hypothetical protein [Gemmatimonadaceae bacterium]